jgi:hypothetical protein
MSGQSTLASFADPDHIREPTKKVYNCQNCDLFRGFTAGPYVSCMGRLKEIPANGCACWSDGKELETMASFAPPAGFVPKKWKGQA